MHLSVSGTSWNVYIVDFPSLLPSSRRVIHRELPLGSFHPWCQLLSLVFVNLPGPSSHRSHAVGKVHLLFILGPSEDQAPDDSGCFLNHFPCLLFMKLPIDYSNRLHCPPTSPSLVYLSICLPTHPSIHTPACQPVYHLAAIHVSLIFPYVSPSFHVSTYPLLCLCTHSSLIYLSVHLSIHPPTHPC